MSGVTCSLPDRWSTNLSSLWRIKPSKALQCLGICLPSWWPLQGGSAANVGDVRRGSGCLRPAPVPWPQLRTGLCCLGGWIGQHQANKHGQMLGCFEQKQEAYSSLLGWDWLTRVGPMQIQPAKSPAGRRAGVWILFVKTSWRSLKTGWSSHVSGGLVGGLPISLGVDSMNPQSLSTFWFCGQDSTDTCGHKRNKIGI